MSNVIHASIDYSGPDKQAVVGKIYEDLFQDSNGNVSVRYYRLIKATSAITAGQLCAVAAADADDLYLQGEAAPDAADETLKFLVAGVAVADIASGEFGFVVCRGVVEGVTFSSAPASVGLRVISNGASGAANGELVATSAALAAGDGLKTLGTNLGTTVSSAIYIDVL